MIKKYKIPKQLKQNNYKNFRFVLNKVRVHYKLVFILEDTAEILIKLLS